MKKKTVIWSIDTSFFETHCSVFICRKDKRRKDGLQGRFYDIRTDKRLERARIMQDALIKQK